MKQRPVQSIVKSSKILLALALFTALVIPAEAIILAQVHFDPWRLAAFLECLSLTIAAVVALTDSHVVRELRHHAIASRNKAVGAPFLLLVPYLILALGTATFSFWAIGKLAAYIAVPTLLLLPDRLHRAQRGGWRDFAAMLALAVPVATGWFDGIWNWPQEVYFFGPFFCVCVGAYDFLVIRGLEDAGFRLIPHKADLWDGLANLAAFMVLGIPLGIVLGFLHPHADSISVWDVAFQFFGIYLTIAIPEELMFRGILQNFLVKTIPSASRGMYGLVIASVVFGASHLHHPPVPNWRYMIMATLAGLFYGNAWRSKHRLPASALTHALVDTMWRFWL
jgi:membrane protease YdiL (CAAX protease family)